MTAYRYLDPAVLKRIASMELRARRVVEGALSGIHRSPHRGSSVEFAEHKEYSPGDEIRLVDWRVYARADRYYVKQFEHETNLRANILLDVSRSMAYRGASAAVSKFEYAATLAASLAVLLHQQGDAVSLVEFADGVRHFIPPRARPGHLREVLRRLEVAVPTARDTDIAAVVRDLAERLPRRSAVFILSDLLDLRPEAPRFLRHLRGRRHDVAVFAVLDRDELDLPFARTTRFESMESDARVLVDPPAVRAAYLRELRRHIDTWRGACVEAGIDFALCPTDVPVDRALRAFLTRRAGAWTAAAMPAG